jgi:hypothetical protein
MPDDPMMIERLRTALSGLPVTEQRCSAAPASCSPATCRRHFETRPAGARRQEGTPPPRRRIQAMEMGGRAMEGYIFVAAEGTATAKI